MDNFQIRENFRNQIKSFWKEGRAWSKNEDEIFRSLKSAHDICLSTELLDITKPKERIVFSVCGYSLKHGYFRAKRFYSETLLEAKAEMELAKKEPDWKIPTIIVKETFLRKHAPAMCDFDGDIGNLGFSDSQELISKHMCGNRDFTWSELIKKDDDRYTY